MRLDRGALHDYAVGLYSHATMTADPSAGDAPHLDETWPSVRGRLRR